MFVLELREKSTLVFRKKFTFVLIEKVCIGGKQGQYPGGTGCCASYLLHLWHKCLATTHLDPYGVTDTLSVAEQPHEKSLSVLTGWG